MSRGGEGTIRGGGEPDASAHHSVYTNLRRRVGKLRLCARLASNNFLPWRRVIRADVTIDLWYALPTKA